MLKHTALPLHLMAATILSGCSPTEQQQSRQTDTPRLDIQTSILCSGLSHLTSHSRSASSNLPNTRLTTNVNEGPDQYCPTDVYTISSGIDLNNDGILQASETDYLRDTCPADDTWISNIVTTSPEPVGANCADGGSKNGTRPRQQS